MHVSFSEPHATATAAIPFVVLAYLEPFTVIVLIADKPIIGLFDSATFATFNELGHLKVGVMHIADELLLNTGYDFFEPLVVFVIIHCLMQAHSLDIGIESEEQLKAVWKRNANSRYLCWWIMSKPQYAKYSVTIHKNDRRAWVAAYTAPEEVLVAFL